MPKSYSSPTLGVLLAHIPYDTKCPNTDVARIAYDSIQLWKWVGTWCTCMPIDALVFAVMPEISTDTRTFDAVICSKRTVPEIPESSVVPCSTAIAFWHWETTTNSASKEYTTC